MQAWKKMNGRKFFVSISLAFAWKKTAAKKFQSFAAGFAVRKSKHSGSLPLSHPNETATNS